MGRGALAGIVAATLLGLAAPALADTGAPVADLNGDKVYDNLSADLAASPDSARVNVIVTLAGGPPEALVGDLQAQVGSFSVGRLLPLVGGFSATVTKSQAEALARLALVASVQENGLAAVENAPQQQSFGVTQARLDDPALDGNADGAATYSSSDMVAAVIDTGIDAGHRDLDGGKVIAFADCTVGPACVLASPYDDHGHGTHVAATIAGDGEARADRLEQGVAPGAALVGVKVLNAFGSGTFAQVVAGIQWAIANRATYGIRVINLSLGSAGCSDGTDALSAAANSAAAAGIVVAVAAGNSGPSRCTVGSPGAAADAVTVGAMADSGTGGFYLASFSSRGPTLDGRIKPDLVAPGVSVVSARAGTATGYTTMSGTSMATPFVAGVALLMLEASPSLTPAQVKAGMTSTAVPWSASPPDVDFGAGRLDAYAALHAAGAPISTPPTVPALMSAQGTLASAGASLAYTFPVTSTAFPVAATLITTDYVSGSSPDLDLQLSDPNGTTVGSGSYLVHSPSNLRQEYATVTVPTLGLYTVTVTANGPPGSYLLDISAGPSPATLASVSPPTVTGTAQSGQVLSASSGVWTGAAPFSAAYQWQRCDAAGTACAAVSGATGRTYTLSTADVDGTLRASVTVSAAGGSLTAASAATGVVVSSTLPVNVTAPVISGTAREGQTLAASAGSWTSSVTLSYAYQWQRGGVAIPGATAGTYIPTSADVGSALRLAVTASGSGGSSTATSAATGPVAAAAPVSVVPPAITGTAEEGQTLSASAGSWSSSVLLTYSYQWQRGGTAIPRATSAAYIPTALDIGGALSVAVTAAGSGGSATATSAATSAVAAAPPLNLAPPSISSGTAQEGQTLSVSSGTWVSSVPLAYAYQWTRDGAAIPGATGPAYTATSADVGSNLRATVAASGSGGSATAISASAGPVAALPPPPPPPPPPPAAAGGDGSGSSGGGAGGGGGSSSGGGIYPDLGLELAANAGSPAVGSTLLYMLAVSGYPGTGGATGVKVTVRLPAGVTLDRTYADRGPGCGGVAAGTVVCDLDFVYPGVIGHITLWTTVTAPGLLTATAAVAEDQPEADDSDNTASVAVVAVDPTPPPPVTIQSPGTRGSAPASPAPAKGKPAASSARAASKGKPAASPVRAASKGKPAASSARAASKSKPAGAVPARKTPAPTVNRGSGPGGKQQCSGPRCPARKQGASPKAPAKPRATAKAQGSRATRAASARARR